MIIKIRMLLIKKKRKEKEYQNKQAEGLVNCLQFEKSPSH
uniref:Uncharacterized protein n=1 Tax=Nelumbo nucifera TaxID=4432 RepID=A0A822YGV7_NELNU|nr:TPA_asm: hypothetical protein HUJ06_010661 [Nelumbo nucifera]